MRRWQWAAFSAVFIVCLALAGFNAAARRAGAAGSLSETAGGGSEKSTPAAMSSGGPGAQAAVTTVQPVYYKNSVIVLMYHEVAAKPKDSAALPLNKFVRQLQLLKANHFHFITMEQYKRFILDHAAVPANSVLMTFDDGYESFYTDAYPVLKKFHVPATEFLIVNTVGNPKHIGIPKLTWSQVRKMHADGYDFYNHTFDSHSYAPTDASGIRQEPMLMGPVYLKNKHRRETTKEYVERVTKDLTAANAILRQKVGNTDDILAFPYGGYTKPLLKLCRKLGIDITFTVKSGINDTDQTNGYRVNAGGINNNPEALIAMMKQGEAAFSKSGGASRHHYLELGMLSAALVCLIALRLSVSKYARSRNWRIMPWKKQPELPVHRDGLGV